MSLVAKLLLEVDFGIRWTAIAVIPGFFSENDLRALIEELVVSVSHYLSGLTEEEQKQELHYSIFKKHMALSAISDSSQISGHLNHLLEMNGAANNKRLISVQASRAAFLLGNIFQVAPNLAAPLISGIDNIAKNWVIDYIVPKVAIDQCIIALIDSGNREAILFLLNIFYSLIASSIGIMGKPFSVDGIIEKRMKDDAEHQPITICAYDGARLPINFKRRPMNHLHLFFPFLLEYLPKVFPNILNLCDGDNDSEIIDYLELIADTTSVIIAMQSEPSRTWIHIVSNISRKSLPVAGAILASTYPHVTPEILLRASLLRLSKDESLYEEIQSFNNRVTFYAIEFALLEMNKASQKGRLMQFAQAVYVWSKNMTFPGAFVLEQHIKAIEGSPGRLIVRCFVVIAFNSQLMEKLHIEEGCKLNRNEMEDAIEIGNRLTQEQVKLAMDFLISGIKTDYPGFSTRTDVSYFPFNLSKWLLAQNKFDDSKELEELGDALLDTCDQLFGRLQEDT